MLEGNIATGDSTVWAKLRHRGMVLLGHAPTDEFAFGSATAQTGNPWDPTRSPGGSSGGSGAMLAARMVPAATGTDTGGSLRWPASACGVTSVKPTYGRVSAYGVIPLVWTRDHCGPMARSAADCALLLSAMAGADQDDPATLAALAPPAAGYPYAPSRSKTPFAGMTFGVPSDARDGLPAATATLFDRFLDEVRTLGARTKAVTLPPLPAGQAGVIGAASGLGETGIYHQQFLPRSTGRYREVTQAVVDASIAAQALPVSGYLDAMRDRTRYMHDLNRMFEREGVTCIVYPATTSDGPRRSDIAGLTILSDGPIGNMAWAGNAGVPVLTTPVGRSAATGMPFGVQIGMRPWQEAELLQLGVDYQAAHPWWSEAPAPLTTARELPTARVVADPRGAPDPTNTDAKPMALHLLPTLSAVPA